MKQIFNRTVNEVNRGNTVVLATVVRQKGSTPRGVGAMMLVDASGLLCGTIGGGSIEKSAIDEAVQLVETGKSHCRHFSLSPIGTDSIGMICGGELDVHFMCLSRDNSESLLVIDEALKRMDNNQSGYLMIDTNNNTISLSDAPKQNTEPGKDIVAVKIKVPERVVIFGGGHVARALARILAGIDFRCTIIDNREGFDKSELYPEDCQVLIGDYSNIRSLTQLTGDDYVVIMTHGHEHDYVVLTQALREEIAYVGVMGSRSKVAILNARLRENGFSEEKIMSVHTPIGLKIGAVTPAEIAISVAAELVMIRASRRDDNEKIKVTDKDIFGE